MADQSDRKQSSVRFWRRTLTMMSLILAGEAVFLPVFHLGRYFKSSLLETYNLDEFQLGNMGAIYGITAMASYFLGGPLADRWSPRRLLAVSLILTAMGSVYMATVPGFFGLCALFGFWGISSILAFWAPLIRATREWGSEDGQGSAFGILEGGRGLASAVIAVVAAYVYALIIGGNIHDPALDAEAVRILVYLYGASCLLAAGCVWLFVPESKPDNGNESTNQTSADGKALHRLWLVLRSPAIWLQAMVIIAAYSAFKMIDNYGLYSEDAYGFSRIESAKLIANISFARVAAAIAAGWIADRYLGIRNTVLACFIMLIACYSIFLFVAPDPQAAWVMTANMVVSCIGFFALRGIYFALLEESGTPRQLTGTAVGVISFVGFTPEIFMGPITGWLIREARAAGDVLVGYQQIFWMLLALSACGAAAAVALRWFGKKA